MIVMSIPRYPLAPDYRISRVIKGGWQLAGGHGSVSKEQAFKDMRLYVEAGVTTFDCADIYTGVESMIGGFLSRHRDDFRAGRMPEVQIHTKYVPDLDSLSTLSWWDVEHAIDRSLRRLGVERLDLVQFHWWDYDIPRYIEAAEYLRRLRDAGKVKHVGVTNFDVPHLKDLLEAGVPVLSNQVQYSLLDHRPENGMLDLCKEHGVSLLCYGTLAGGFLSDRYLGAPPPEPPLENRSLVKYMLIIDEFGGWDLLQKLLRVLRGIADKHQTSIAAVATRYVLQKQCVAAAVVGVRHSRHLSETTSLFDFELGPEDLAAIRKTTAEAAGPAGDVYALERIKSGRHAAIMKYNLNREAGE